MNITVDEMMSFSPCEDYSRSRVEGLWGGRESLSASEIASLEIPALDRIWALCQVLGSRDLTSLVAFAQSCADRAKTSETAEAARAAAWAAEATRRAARAAARAARATGAARAAARAARATGAAAGAAWAARTTAWAAAGSAWAATRATGATGAAEAARVADLQISIDELVKRLEVAGS